MDDNEEQRNTSFDFKIYEFGAHFDYKQLYAKLEELLKNQQNKNQLSRFNKNKKITFANYPQSRNFNYYTYINQEEENVHALTIKSTIKEVNTGNSCITINNKKNFIEKNISKKPKQIENLKIKKNNVK